MVQISEFLFKKIIRQVAPSLSASLVLVLPDERRASPHAVQIVRLLDLHHRIGHLGLLRLLGLRDNRVFDGLIVRDRIYKGASDFRGVRLLLSLLG